MQDDLISRMTREEASKIIKDGIEDMSLDFADEEQYEALNIAISALSTLDVIRSIINLPHIQEDVMRYKMICEVVDKHTKGESE